jgi:hypothetical protein
MLNGDAAKYRTQDMIRASEAHRASKAQAKRHAAGRNARLRTAMSSTVAMLTIPFHR